MPVHFGGEDRSYHRSSLEFAMPTNCSEDPGGMSESGGEAHGHADVKHDLVEHFDDVQN